MYNLVAILEDSAREYPDKDAVVFDSIRLTYQQIDALSAQVANALVAKGIRKGDKVAFTCPNVPYLPILRLAPLTPGPPHSRGPSQYPSTGGPARRQIELGRRRATLPCTGCLGIPPV